MGLSGLKRIGKRELKMTDFTRENFLAAKNVYTRVLDIVENSQNTQLFVYDMHMLEHLKAMLENRVSTIDRVIKREFEAGSLNPD